MDIITSGVVLILVFLVSFLFLIFRADCDIPTFFASHFGKNPGKVFSGKIVWVTGASSGIGENVAKQCFQLNSKIIISAQNKKELERVKQECLEKDKGRKSEDVLVLPFDMTNVYCHEECFKTVILHFGKLDFLISNAGRSQRAKWELIDLKVDKELFDLNVFSLVNLNRIVLRYFLEVGGGHLAVTSSMAGVLGVPFSAAYTGSKFALHGYFDCLRNEIRTKNIDITLLCPGPTFSQFLSNCFTDKPGEKFKGEMKKTDSRMSAERCAQLILIAIANRIEQSWISIYPFLQLAYLQAYLPYISAKFSAHLARTGYYMKARDSKK